MKVKLGYLSGDSRHSEGNRMDESTQDTQIIVICGEGYSIYFYCIAALSS
jgi:hypothetical protein